MTNQQFVPVTPKTYKHKPNTGTLMPNNAASGQLSASVSLVLVNEYGVRELTEDSERWLNATVKSFYKFMTHDIHIEHVTHEHITSWIDFQLEQGLKPITVNSYLRGFKTIYSRLIRLGHTGHNPTQGIKFVPEGPKTPKAVSWATYQRLLGAAGNERDKAIVSTFWATGCRLGGLLSMNYDSVDSWMEGNQPCHAVLVVEKFSKPRWVYVDGEEALNLSQWIDVRPKVRCEALFLSNKKQRLSEGGISGLFRKLRRIAELPKGTISNPHSFRHAFAIRKLDEGHDLALVSQWLGHNDPAFTASVYAIRSEAQLRAAFFKKK